MMPAAKLPWESYAAKRRFPQFDTQESAAAAGAPGAKEYVPEWDKKTWFDPDADRPGPNKTLFKQNNVPMVLYSNAFLNDIDPATGNGVVGSFMVTVEQAKRVNLPPVGLGANVPATGFSVAEPLLALGPNQAIQRRTDRQAPGLAIRNLDVPLVEDSSVNPMQDVMDAIAALKSDIAALSAKVERILTLPA